MNEHKTTNYSNKSKTSNTHRSFKKHRRRSISNRIGNSNDKKNKHQRPLKHKTSRTKKLMKKSHFSEAFQVVSLSKIKDASPARKRPNDFSDSNFSNAKDNIDKTSNPLAYSQQNYNYKVFTSFDQARSACNQLKKLCESCDKLNVVIKQEGDMNDPTILNVSDKITIFAGEAWYLIHQRRIEEGWYNNRDIGFAEKNAITDQSSD